eukprot:3390440-Alexandrium_andersonii.AAC.1
MAVHLPWCKPCVRISRFKGSAVVFKNCVGNITFDAVCSLRALHVVLRIACICVCVCNSRPH